MEQSFLDQYRAVREAAGILDLTLRRKLKITGADHVQFLHSMISNDVLGLEALQGRYGTLLRPTGKLVADFYYYRFPDHILIDIAPSLAQGFLEAVERLIVMDDVTFADVSDDWAHLSIQGPKSLELIQLLLNTPGPDTPLSLLPVVWKGDISWLINKSQLADKGFEIVTPLALEDSLRNELLEPRAEFSPVEITTEVADVLRLERGVPVFGIDMNENNNPIEAGLREAISLDKGCYVGQEVVSKATYVGGVGRHLRPLLIATAEPVSAGARLVLDEGKRVGHVTSSAFSPALGRTVALGYLKRDFAEPGRRLRVETPEGEYEVEVSEAAAAVGERGAVS